MVDGQPIDTQDPHWALIITLENPCPTSDQPAPGARLTGFATVYKFYHHPDGVRHRISQVKGSAGQTQVATVYVRF